MFGMTVKKSSSNEEQNVVDQKWIFYEKATNENTSKTKKLFFYKTKRKAAVIDSCCRAIHLFEDTTQTHTYVCKHDKKIKLEFKTLKKIFEKAKQNKIA